MDAAVLDQLERAAESSLLQLAAVSVWEVGTLEARGILRFDIPCDQWVTQALGVPGLQVVPLSPAIAPAKLSASGAFPG